VLKGKNFFSFSVQIKADENIRKQTRNKRILVVINIRCF